MEIYGDGRGIMIRIFPDGKRKIRRAVEKAEEVFLRAWFETKI
jgi:hypothetical protein